MFDDAQKKELGATLDPKHVKKRQGFDYVEGWHVIAEANRIFGFDGWCRNTVELIENTNPTKNQKGNNVVSFRAKVEITVGSVTRTGIGFGNGIAKDIHDAYESATKEAETDAMKRAMMTFGNPFGLALYDKKKENVAVPEQQVDWDALAERVSKAINNAKSADDVNSLWDHGKTQSVLDNVSESVVSSLIDARAAKIESFKTAFPGDTNG